MRWDLRPGDKIIRKALHDEYGGARYTGMSPSSVTPNIMLFTDPKSGEQHGYYDGWASDGVFEYSGEGQSGDQTMTKGNKALRDHRADGRAVRLFTGTGGLVTYEGEFDLDPDEPYVERSAHSTDGGPDRRVFVFRLRPARPSTEGISASSEPARHDGIVAVPIAEQNVETWSISPTKAKRASAVESQLVRRYRDHLAALGDVVGRHRYKSSSGYLFNDVFNETRDQLIEAKGSAHRTDVRMAIGQLLDYAALEPGTPAMALLTPLRPEEDLLALLEVLDIAAIWIEGKSFVDTTGGTFC